MCDVSTRTIQEIRGHRPHGSHRRARAREAGRVVLLVSSGREVRDHRGRPRDRNPGWNATGRHPKDSLGNVKKEGEEKGKGNSRREKGREEAERSEA
jgi:hypothetical protein